MRRQSKVLRQTGKQGLCLNTQGKTDPALPFATSEP